MTRPRALAGLLVVLVAAAGLAGCGSEQGQRLSIATGGSGGVYFVYGGGWPSRSASTWTATRRPPRSPRPRSTTCT